MSARGMVVEMMKFGELTVAVAIGLVTVACTSGAQRGRDATTPSAEQPTPAAEETPVAAPAPISGPFFLDLPTGEQTPLPENLPGGYNYVASPDGTQLVYGTCCSGADVMTIANIDGSGARRLESPEGLNYYGARWSPDGTMLAYQERDGGGDDAATGDVGNLFLHDLVSGERTQLTDLELTRAWWYFLFPSFSLDGQSVIFHLPRTRSEATKWDVWSVPVTGGEPTLMLRDAAFPMDRIDGPEGLQIAFVRPRPNSFAGDRLSVGAEDGHIRRRLIDANVSIWWPTMSPDGNRIAYQDGGSIYVVVVETGESSDVADGNTVEWLDNDTLIVTRADHLGRAATRPTA